MSKNRNDKRLIILTFAGLLILLSCNQRYWFRSKVNTEKDSTGIEKNYHIVW